MTQVDEGRGAVQGVGAPVGGEILAGRYQLDQHVNTDSSGRQIWRGVDVILRRAVAVVIRYPGGPPATQMLQAAVEASRIVHPNLVGVYDAIDEDVRAYVVREWVDGSSLRDHIATGLFDAERAVAVAHAVSAAVTAVHSTGMTHGNVHPGTVLIGLDGRVVLADARADGAAPAEEDIRAVGGLLYFALTGYWPHGEVAGPTPLPDAPRDPSGGLASPRQVRAGVPDFLDNLTMDLLDRRLSVPSADVLVNEFARLDAPAGTGSYEQGYYPQRDQRDQGPEPEPEVGAGPLRLTTRPDPAATRPSGRKVVAGVAALLVVGVVGLLVGLNWLTGDSPPAGGSPGASSATTAPPGGDTPNPEIAPISIAADQVRIVDPGGDRTELDGVEAVVDSDLGTSWSTDTYRGAPNFGNIAGKEGMGILINLGEPRHVATVKVELSNGGAVAEMRAGESDPGSTTEGDQQIVETYAPIGESQQEGGSTIVFSGFDSESTYQFLMVWFTELPPAGDGYKLEVLQVTVEGY